MIQTDFEFAHIPGERISEFYVRKLHQPRLSPLAHPVFLDRWHIPKLRATAERTLYRHGLRSWSFPPEPVAIEVKKPDSWIELHR